MRTSRIMIKLLLAAISFLVVACAALMVFRVSDESKAVVNHAPGRCVITLNAIHDPKQYGRYLIHANARVDGMSLFHNMYLGSSSTKEVLNLKYVIDGSGSVYGVRARGVVDQYFIIIDTEKMIFWTTGSDTASDDFSKAVKTLSLTARYTDFDFVVYEAMKFNAAE